MNSIFEAFVNGSIVSAVVVLAVSIILGFSPRTSLNAATRYWIWWSALLASAALVVLCLPLTRNAGLEASVHVRVTPTENAREVAASRVQEVPFAHPSPNSTAFRRLFPIRIAAGPWVWWIAFVWSIVTALMLVRLIGSYIFLDRKRRRAKPLDRDRTARLDAKLARLGLRRCIRILISEEAHGPMAIGPIRPCIVLPSKMFEAVDEAELDQVVLHEVAHLERFDDCVVMLQRLIQAIFFFHPVVLWISNRLDMEREIACDDFVVDTTGEATLYASCLTHIAEIAGGISGSPMAAFATRSRPVLVKRVEFLLDNRRAASAGMMTRRLMFLLAVIGAITPIALIIPRPVVFSAPAKESVRQPVVPVVEETPAAPSTSATPPAAIKFLPAVSRPRVLQQVPPATVTVQVLVRDRLGRYVSGFQKEQFRILEDGVEQAIEQFSADTDGPISVCIVSDISSGVSGNELILQAAERALSTLATTDEMCLVEFENGPRLAVPLSAGTDQIAGALRSSHSTQPVNLLEGLQLALRTVRSGRNPLKAILIVSDREAQTPPAFDTSQVGAIAGGTDVPVYALSATGTSSVLDDIASLTGGTHVAVRSPGDADALGTRALIGIRNSYLLGFHPSKPIGDGAFHQLKVEYIPVRGIPALNVTFRAGYFSR